MDCGIYCIMANFGRVDKMKNEDTYNRSYAS